MSRRPQKLPDGRRSTRPGWRRTTCCVAVREDDAYANLVLPQLLRERRIEGRDAAFATELVGGTLRGLGAYDAVIDHLAGRRARPGRPRRAAPRRPPAARDAGARPRRGDQHRRAGARRGSATSRPASPTPCCAGSPSATWTRGWTLLDAPGQCALLAPAVDRRRARPGAGPARRAGGAAGRRQRATAGDAGGAARAVDGRGAGAAFTEPAERTLSPLGVVLESGDPGAIPAVRDGRAGVQDAGSQLVALALARAAVDGPRRALAGPVRRSRREGGPARRPRRPSAVRGCWPTSDSRTARKLVAQALRATGRRRRRR